MDPDELLSTSANSLIFEPKKKIIFTTAKKKVSSNSIVKDSMNNEIKNKKPKKSRAKKPLKDGVDNNSSVPDDKIIPSEPIENKKLSKRRRSTKKSEDAVVNKELKELKISSPSSSLSVEAVPFIPEKILNDQKSSIVKERKPVSRPKPILKSENDLRSIEIKQLQIRFSPTGFSQKKNSLDDSILIQCVMPITDPDFAYDLQSVRLEIHLPKLYPGTKSSPIRPSFTILNSDLPIGINSRIERNMKWGVNSLEGGILVCRPMLRYLEDNLEKWMVDDVRDSVFKFVKPNEIKVSEKKPENVKDIEEMEGDHKEEEIFDVIMKPSSSCKSRISNGDWIAPPPISDQSSVGGQSFTLKLFFSTIHGIDLLTSQLITLLVSCERCKFNFPVEDLRPFVDRIEHCPKCTNQTKFYYKSQLVTPGLNLEDVDDDDEFETILGSIRFLRAKPVDLLPSLYQCACSRCYGNIEENNSTNTSTSSSCKIEKVKLGENISYNCFSCHQKIRFLIDRIEWVSETIPGVPDKKQQQQIKSKGGQALSVGSPLPLNGACEHYKKSFRWYRFPCCGQAFPCDECHEKDPIAKDHPIEWATRFICGFCSREQSINIKECPECGKDTSASGRRHTSFWEGGKGARNQILMSRKDSKKYKDYSLNSSKTKKKS